MLHRCIMSHYPSKKLAIHAPSCQTSSTKAEKHTSALYTANVFKALAMTLHAVVRKPDTTGATCAVPCRTMLHRHLSCEHTCEHYPREAF